MSRWMVYCPHCGTGSTVRTSRQLTETVREAMVQCNNAECAHSWVAHLAAVRTIAPSMTPNPRVCIPLSPHSPAARAANDGQLELAMDHPPPRPLPTG